MFSLKTKSLKNRFLAYPTALHCNFLLNYDFSFFKTPLIVITLTSFHRLQSLSIKFVMNFLIRNVIIDLPFIIFRLVGWSLDQDVKPWESASVLCDWHCEEDILAFPPFWRKKNLAGKNKSRWSWRCGLKEYRGLCAG